LVGGFVLGAFAAVLGYAAAYAVINRYRARFGHAQRLGTPLPPGRT